MCAQAVGNLSLRLRPRPTHNCLTLKSKAEIPSGTVPSLRSEQSISPFGLKQEHSFPGSGQSNPAKLRTTKRIKPLDFALECKKS